MSPSTDRKALRTWLGALMAAVAIALLSAAMLQWFTGEREAMVARFSDERLDQIRTVATLVAEDVADVTDDLELARQLLHANPDRESRRRELEALLGVVRSYRAAAIIDADATIDLLVSDPRTDSPLPSQLTGELANTAAKALERPGVVTTSPTIVVDRSVFRLFAVSLSASDQQETPPGALAVAVDTTYLLAGLRLVSSDPQSELLVLGPNGEPVPASDDRLAAAYLDRGSVAHAALAPLVERMRAGETGAMTLSRERADAMGFAPGELVAAFAPVSLKGGGHWAIATLSSLAPLRAHERALLVRVSAVALTVGLLILALVVYVLVSMRRAALLEQRLRHAAEITALDAQLLNAEKLATVGVLAAGIAHEIGTPLGVIRGRAEFALRKLGADHPQAAGLGIIVEQIDRVSRIIQELLNFARIQPADTAPASLRAIVDGVVDLLDIELGRKALTVEVDIPEDLPRLAADRDQLQQVVLNLLVNARDASDEGGRIWVRARHADDEDRLVRFEIGDEGCGIPDEQRHQIFDPFFTTKKRGQGTGLGLSVVSKIVRNHGGTIEVDSRVGRGTTFRIGWPVSVASTQTTVREHHDG